MPELVLLPANLESKYTKLKEVIKSYGSIIIAYSGGVDSSLLSLAGYDVLPESSISVTVSSEFLSGYDLRDAIDTAKKHNFKHRIININVLDNPEVTANTKLRCRFCKQAVIEEIFKIKNELGYNYILDGANLDDSADYRPGQQAAVELGVKSPFVEAGFTKQDIRNLAKFLSLELWNKPAAACLASRIPYNTVITKDILKKIRLSEEFIKNLGYQGFRVRHHGEIARIELVKADISKFILNHSNLIDTALKNIGYSFVTVDLSGYETGSLNKIKDN